MPRWRDPIGLASLLLAWAGLVCAPFPVVGWLTPFLCSAGLLVGLAGFFRALIFRSVRLLLAGAGIVASCLLLLVSLLQPWLLGPVHEDLRARDPVSPRTIRVIPLAGRDAGDTAGPDWVDASRAALQQGALRLQVVNAWVSTTDTGSSGQKPQRLLCIRLRVQRVEIQQPAENGEQPPPRPKDKPVARLTDSAENVYAQRDAQEGLPGGKGRNPFPVAVTDEVLVFESPPADVGNLRLEVPATTWGGSGAFRFTLPSRMVRQSGGN
jgi:hypothetical protein